MIVVLFLILEVVWW